MGPPPLEELFERYRARGELAALGAVFDRSAPGLLALAVHLVRDPVEAEDLVQATFVAAIEGARSFDPAQRLEPWLAGILARKAARCLRERARRPEPGRVEREGERDPAALVQDAEAAREIERALERLEEPARGVLAAYLRGERPLDIARASGRAAGTVRMQVLRGLERLRRVLPAGLHGLAPFPRGLGTLRAEVLRQGGLAVGAGSAALGVSSGAPIAGGVVLSSKVVVSVSAAVLLALLAAWSWWREPRGGEEVASVPREVELAPAAVLELEAVPLAPGREPAREERTEAALPAAREGGESKPLAARPAGLWLVGELLGLGAEPPDRTEIAVTTMSGPSAGGKGALDATYSIELTSFLDWPAGAPAAVYVTATHPARRKTSVELPLPEAARIASRRERTEIELDLDLAPRTVVVGRVDTGRQVWAESVTVGLAREVASDEGPRIEFSDETECDKDGFFELYPDVAGDQRLIARAWQLPPVTTEVHVVEREVTDAGVLALEPGGVAIEGQVVLPFPAEVAFFQVRALAVGSDSRPVDPADTWLGVSVGTREIRVVEGQDKPRSDGLFRITGLAPGTYTLQLEQEGGLEVVLPSPGLTVTAPATGVVFGEHLGRTRVTVTAQGDAPERVELAFLVEQGRHTRHVRCGEVTEVISDRRAPLSVEAFAPRWKRAHHESPPLTLAVEDELVLELVPDDEHATLALDWTLDPGLPPPSWVTASWRRGDEEGEVSAQAGDGHCRFEVLQPGRYRIALEPRGKDFWEPIESYLCTEPFEVALAAGRTTRVEVVWRAGGRARLVPDASAREARPDSLGAAVLDPWGRPLPVLFTQREYADGGIRIGSYRGAMPISAPSELQPNLAPGAYVLVLSEDGLELQRIPFTIRAGETVEVPFVVR